MNLIIAPDEIVLPEKSHSLMLCGGISNTANWQACLISSLSDTNIDATLLNPRRDKFDIADVEMERRQIEWEFLAMSRVTAVSFWFSPETVCPITLLELGKMLVDPRKIFIGIHPDYRRKRDVEIQTQLARPGVEICYTLDDLEKAIIKWDAEIRWHRLQTEKNKALDI